MLTSVSQAHVLISVYAKQYCFAAGVPADEISVQDDGGHLVVEWSDCDSFIRETEKGRYKLFRVYDLVLSSDSFTNSNIRSIMPNFLTSTFESSLIETKVCGLFGGIRSSLLISVYPDRKYFKDQILNHDLQESSWTLCRNSLERILDSYGHEIRLFHRHDGRTEGAGILITTAAPPSEGHRMKIYCMKISFQTFLEYTHHKQGPEIHFIVTDLHTLEYCAKQIRRIHKEGAGISSRGTTHGRPESQNYSKHDPSEADKIGPVIKVPIGSLPSNYDTVFL